MYDQTRWTRGMWRKTLFSKFFYLDHFWLTKLLSIVFVIVIRISHTFISLTVGRDVHFTTGFNCPLSILHDHTLSSSSSSLSSLLFNFWKHLSNPWSFLPIPFSYWQRCRCRCSQSQASARSVRYFDMNEISGAHGSNYVEE